MRIRAGARWLAIGLVVVAASSACGENEVDTGNSQTVTSTAASVSVVPSETVSTLPVSLVDDTGREVTVTSTDRIVPVNGDLAEVVFALGLGEQVVATDLSATFPPAADAKPEIGYQRALQAEPILAFEPTVVLADELAGPPETLEQLRAIGVPVVVIERDRTLAGPAAKIRAVGRALGVPGRAEILARQVEGEIDAATDATTRGPESAPRVLALYLRGETVQLALGAGSGIDALIEGVGGVNVGTEMGIHDTQPITAESVVAARPDAIVVTTTGLESVGGVEGLLDIAALARTPAGRDGRIFAYEDQYLYGFGPRTGQLLTDLARDLHAVRPTTIAGIVAGADPDVDAVVAAYSVVFDSAVPFDQKAASLMEAEALRPTVDAYAQAGGRFGGIKLVPTAVAITGDTATVTYDVMFGTTPQYTGLTGSAVRHGGSWMVTRDEFCSFMSSARTPCPAA